MFCYRSSTFVHPLFLRATSLYVNILPSVSHPLTLSGAFELSSSVLTFAVPVYEFLYFINHLFKTSIIIAYVYVTECLNKVIKCN